MKRIVIVVAAAILVTACGAATTGSTSSPEPSLSPTLEPTPEPTPLPTVVVSCPPEMERLVGELVDLDSRLNVGLTFADYGERVTDVSVAYGRLDIEGLDLLCLVEVGVPAEAAMNLYLDAYRIWKDCLNNIGCNSGDPLTAKLQKKWAKATKKVDSAKDSLN